MFDTIILFGYSFLQGFAEDLSQFPDESFDAVIETLVLCSVNSVEKSLQEIQRVLKPGGVFCFLDHAKGPEATWLVTIQNFLTSTVSQYWNSIFSSNQPEQKFLKDISAASILEIKKCVVLTRLKCTVFPHMISAETLVFWIWKSKGHST